MKNPKTLEKNFLLPCVTSYFKVEKHSIRTVRFCPQFRVRKRVRFFADVWANQYNSVYANLVRFYHKQYPHRPTAHYQKRSRKPKRLLVHLRQFIIICFCA